MPRARLVPSLALVAVAALALSGCAAPGDQASDGTIRIVASTNVYADIARSVVGDGVEVTAIIDDIAQDPHEYEAGARDALAISRADIVILNGGGYDEFMHTLLDAQSSDATIIDVAHLSGLDPDADFHDHGDDEHGDDGHGHDDAEHDHADHGDFNEHVWYHLGTMGALADEIIDALDAQGFESAGVRDRAVEFKRATQDLMFRADEIAAAHRGVSVAVTEPVPLYLLELAGLANVTPAAFSEAVEEGSDAPALVVHDMLGLVAHGSVAFLAYNEQTVGPQTQQVLEAANAAGTPVVSFSELLPEGLGYVEWMTANLDAIEAALS